MIDPAIDSLWALVRTGRHVAAIGFVPFPLAGARGLSVVRVSGDEGTTGGVLDDARLAIDRLLGLGTPEPQIRAQTSAARALLAEGQEVPGTLDALVASCNLEKEPLPVVLTGDFNSAGDGSQTPTYGDIVHAGFLDAWAQAHPRDPGYTCCQPADLHQSAPLDQRLDLVFVRESPCRDARRIHGHVEAVIVGNRPSDRTSSGLWPSDHAGVAATLRAE